MLPLLLPRLARRARLGQAPILLSAAQQLSQHSQQGGSAVGWTQHVPCGPDAAPIVGTFFRNMSLLSPENVTKLSASFNALPHSLRHERPPLMPPDMEKSRLGRLALKLLMYNDIKNQHIVNGQLLYDDIKEQVDDFALHKAFGLDPKIFYSTFTLLSIHVWLIVHRLGNNPDRDTRFFMQRFYNQFQYDVERRIYEAGVMVGVSKWTKKLETVFYNSSQEFDLVLHKQSNDTFENIIISKFFGGDLSKRVQAQLIAKYLLYEVECLKLTDKEDIMKGHILFSRAPFEPYRRKKAADHTVQGADAQET